MTRTTIDELLQRSREGLERLGPEQARRAMERQGAALIDIRSDVQRASDGEVPGALHVPRNVLEWRLDADCASRDPAAPELHQTVIVMCHEGYQSSLAAATLQQLGFSHATDLDGGFEAWCVAGLPTRPLNAADPAQPLGGSGADQAR